MRLAASLALVICLSSAPAYADLVDPDTGLSNNSPGTNNNATTGNTANTGNNATTGGNNGTAGENNGTTPTVDSDTTPAEKAEEKGGCSVASLQGAAPVAPLLLGVALLGLTRRRRE